jgi:hypothetical protein
MATVFTTHDKENDNLSKMNGTSGLQEKTSVFKDSDTLKKNSFKSPAVRKPLSSRNVNQECTSPKPQKGWADLIFIIAFMYICE